MTDLMLNNLYLVILLPLWLFLIIMFGRFFAVYVNKYIIYSLTLLSSFFGILLCATCLLTLKNGQIIETQIPFIKIQDFIISIGLHIDKLSLIFALTLFLVSLLVQIYSIRYMQQDKKKYRFYALINLFNFGMVGLFFSPNMFQTYFFWEIASIVSYLLICYEYNKNEKSVASKKVLIVNRIGDTAFLAGILLSSYYMYTYVENHSFATLLYTDMPAISTFILAYTSDLSFIIICLLFFVAAIVKSAQFPFYSWLQDAMQAKLPVSALLHSATLVALGVFLTIRLMPLYTLQADMLKIIILIGLITAIICSFSASAQTNPKKTLAYSTSAQFGLIYYAIGILNIKLGIILFIAHAFTKPMLFLALPENNKKWDYANLVYFILGALSLAGIFFSGFFAKEGLFDANISLVYKYFLYIATILTVFYITRIIFVIINNNSLEKSKFSILQNIPNTVFILLNILFAIYLARTVHCHLTLILILSVLTCGLTCLIYAKQASFRIPLLYQLSYNGFYIEKFYNKIIVKLYELTAIFANLIEHKIFENYTVVKNSAKICANTVLFIENKIMNGTVTLFTKFWKKCSQIFKFIQTGNIQNYNAYALIIITLIITGLVIFYERINEWKTYFQYLF